MSFWHRWIFSLVTESNWPRNFLLDDFLSFRKSSRNEWKCTSRVFLVSGSHSFHIDDFIFIFFLWSDCWQLFFSLLLLLFTLYKQLWNSLVFLHKYSYRALIGQFLNTSIFEDIFSWKDVTKFSTKVTFGVGFNKICKSNLKRFFFSEKSDVHKTNWESCIYACFFMVSTKSHLRYRSNKNYDSYISEIMWLWCDYNKKLQFFSMEIHVCNDVILAF